jgi:hypothetical protein
MLPLCIPPEAFEAAQQPCMKIVASALMLGCVGHPAVLSNCLECVECRQLNILVAAAVAVYDAVCLGAVCLGVGGQVGSDDDGYAVRLRLEHFLRYCCYPHHAGSDDSPLYIFDGTFADR